METTRTVPHGTVNGYNNYRCRCDECRHAGSVYQEARRRRAGQKPWAEAFDHLKRHGWNRYKRGGCRCAICKAAAAAQKRRQRANNADHYREYWRQRKAAKKATP